MPLGLTLQLLCFGHSHRVILHTAVFHWAMCTVQANGHVPHISLLDVRRQGSKSQKLCCDWELTSTLFVDSLPFKTHALKTAMRDSLTQLPQLKKKKVCNNMDLVRLGRHFQYPGPWYPQPLQTSHLPHSSALTDSFLFPRAAPFHG